MKKASTKEIQDCKVAERPRGGSKKRGFSFTFLFFICPVKNILVLQNNSHVSVELWVEILGDVFPPTNVQVFAIFYLIQILRWDTWKCFSFAVVVVLKCFALLICPVEQMQISSSVYLSHSAQYIT